MNEYVTIMDSDSMDEHIGIHCFPTCMVRDAYAAGQADKRPVYGAGCSTGTRSSA